LKRTLLLAAVLATMAVPSNSAGNERLGQIGVQGGYGSELDWYLGVRTELKGSRLFKRARTAVDFDWFFPGGDLNYFEFDWNYLWPLASMARSNQSNFYFGAGLNLGRGWISGGDSNWEFGINTLVGLNFGLGVRAAFVEGGYTFITDFDQWHIGTGLLF
jgi:hypothetical protein